MITVRPGSHTFRLLQLLSITGEFPVSSLSLMGSVRSLSELVHKLESKQRIRLPDGSVFGDAKVFKVSGKRPNRTIRLSLDIIPLLEYVHPDALQYYLTTFSDHHFPGDFHHIQRNHRIAESIASCMMAGIEYRPYLLPQLQNSVLSMSAPDWARYYISRDAKRLTGDEFNKTMYSRMVGALFYPGGHYAVYNTRGAVMKWKGRGEAKAALSVDELARWNNAEQPGVMGSYSALLIGRDHQIVLETLREAAKDRDRTRHFHSIYSSIHFIPLDRNGARLLRVLALPDWNEMIIDSLYPPEMRIREVSNFDAQRGGTFYVSHLDSDIAKLIRIKQSATCEDIEMICFPWQAGFVAAFFESKVRIRTVDMDWLEVTLGMK